MSDNTLYYGDNLDILRRYIKDETVDLVYLDPPFNSNASYNVLFAEKDGTQAASQIKAFDDTWHWTIESARQFEETVESGGKVADALMAFRTLLGHNDMLAYLTMMAPRLVELRRVLKPTGSLYLHCDPTASHYLKILLDAVFGVKHFRNELVWKRTTPSSSKARARRYPSDHDIVFYYTVSGDYLYSQAYLTYPEAEIAKRFRRSDERGRYKDAELATYSEETLERLRAENRLIVTPGGKFRYKIYLEEIPGVPVDDVWTDVHPINSQAQERLGYPTQKPQALLERILSASSNEGDLVLDPFCGCGTTVAAAQKLGRRWIGIDITHLAITLMKKRLADSFGDIPYTVVGEPTSVHDAATLAAQDPYQFQWWALGLVGARPIEQKKGADKGIDGRILFHDEPVGGKTKQIILSVKAGHITRKHVMELRGVVEREDAALGVLIAMHNLTGPMRDEAASAGFYSLPWNPEMKYPKVQLLTVEDLLSGKRIDCPPVHQASATFKKAPKVKGPQASTVSMDFDDQTDEEE